MCGRGRGFNKTAERVAMDSVKRLRDVVVGRGIDGGTK